MIGRFPQTQILSPIYQVQTLPQQINSYPSNPSPAMKATNEDSFQNYKKQLQESLGIPPISPPTKPMNAYMRFFFERSCEERSNSKIVKSWNELTKKLTAEWKDLSQIKKNYYEKLYEIRLKERTALFEEYERLIGKKKPLPPFARYLKKRYAQYSKEYRNYSSSEINKLVKVDWHKITEKEKKKLEDQYEQEKADLKLDADNTDRMDEYKEKLEAYQEEIREEKEKIMKKYGISKLNQQKQRKLEKDKERQIRHAQKLIEINQKKKLVEEQRKKARELKQKKEQEERDRVRKIKQQLRLKEKEKIRAEKEKLKKEDAERKKSAPPKPASKSVAKTPVNKVAALPLPKKQVKPSTPKKSTSVPKLPAKKPVKLLAKPAPHCVYPSKTVGRSASVSQSKQKIVKKPTPKTKIIKKAPKVLALKKAVKVSVGRPKAVVKVVEKPKKQTAVKAKVEVVKSRRGRPAKKSIKAKPRRK